MALGWPVIAATVSGVIGAMRRAAFGIRGPRAYVRVRAAAEEQLGVAVMLGDRATARRENAFSLFPKTNVRRWPKPAGSICIPSGRRLRGDAYPRCGAPRSAQEPVVNARPTSTRRQRR